MKLKFLLAVIVLFSILLFGCVPEADLEDSSETSETATVSAETDSGTSVGTTDKNGVFGSIEEKGSLPEIPFEEFK